MINFLLENGANMKKHLFFRDGHQKLVNNQNYIDNAIILKIIFTYAKADKIELDFLYNYLKPDNKVGLDDYTNDDFIKSLQTYINSLNIDSKESLMKILHEEIVFPLKSSIICCNNKLELILYIIAPFMNLPFNLSIDWILNLELKYFFIKLIKSKNQINLEEKKIIIDYIWENYIKNNLFTEDYLGNLISQWISVSFNK
jgi:hypothetical protein